ncbi:MAG: ferritin-like domain-containing protein [Sporichthyaceae bacterium]|nr:ferritin-like domain-containing protein [Sporichthyaceae bacterium]
MSTSPSTPGTSRRAVLVAGVTLGAAGLAGCARAGSSRPAISPEPSPARPGRQARAEPDPDRMLRQRLAIGSMVLISHYQAAIDRHPKLERRLAALRSDHRAHVDALTGSDTVGAAPAPDAPTPAGIAVPASSAAAVRRLAAAESAASSYRLELVQTVSAPGLAALLAAIAASQQVHSSVLRAGEHDLEVEPAPVGRLPDGPIGATTVDALQDALAAEHAAVYGYGTLGAWLAEDGQIRAHQAHDAHRRRRDRLEEFIRRAGAEPAPAAAAYQLPFAVSDGARARKLAARIETAVAGSYGWLVAAAEQGSSVRTDAAGWLTEAAVRAASWGTSQALPGLPAR